MDSDAVPVALPANCCHQPPSTDSGSPGVRFVIAAVYPAGTHLPKPAAHPKECRGLHHLLLDISVTPSVGSFVESCGPVNSLLTAGDALLQATPLIPPLFGLHPDLCSCFDNRRYPLIRCGLNHLLVHTTLLAFLGVSEPMSLLQVKDLDFIQGRSCMHLFDVEHFLNLRPSF